MRVVVTGGAGFIGANLCRALAAAASVSEVVAFDDLSTGRKENLEGLDGVRFVEGTILDAGALDDVVGGAGAVVHLAALGAVPRSIAAPMPTHDANATGTLQVLEAVRRADGPYLVVASSSSVYGANPSLPKSESLVPLPVSPYAASKLATEAYALAHAAAYGLDVLAFRFFNVFGPLQPAGHVYAAVVPTFVAAALAGRPLPVHGDGRQTRDFTYVDSVTAVVVDAVSRRVTSPGAVNLAFGTRVPLLELIAQLETVLGQELEVDHGPPRPGDVRDSQADQTRLRSLFPDVAATPLVDGLRTTVAWFRSTPPAPD
ncbi:MAG TPA: NAD-dependent epimerase/dehydratase family protein [Acidimicrobiales bacterium]|nr:NAD-dependent epimerase/dehydratase family protein [Acidimicrobiales bacterium]